MTVRNQAARRHRVDARQFKRILLAVLRHRFADHDIEIAYHLVTDRKIAQINESFLGHDGPTDVITFDYNDPDEPNTLAGEAFIGMDVACRQAAEYGTHWTEELVRYAIHACLHLAGYDDRTDRDRRRMKREEERLLAWSQSCFNLRSLETEA